MSNASGAIWDLIKHWVINWCSTNSDLWCFLFQIRLIIVVLFTFHKRSTKWSTFLTQSWALGQNSYSSFFEGVSQSQLETCGILQGCVWNHNAPLAQLGFISDLSHNVFNLLQIWDHWDKRLSPESFWNKTQRVFDVRKDSQFIEPRAKTNKSPTSSEALSCFCCKLIQFDKLCDSFRKSKTLWVFSKRLSESQMIWNL